MNQIWKTISNLKDPIDLVMVGFFGTMTVILLLAAIVGALAALNAIFLGGCDCQGWQQ